MEIKKSDRKLLMEINRKLAMLSFLGKLSKKDSDIIATRLFKERDKIIKKYDKK